MMAPCSRRQRCFRVRQVVGRRRSWRRCHCYTRKLGWERHRGMWVGRRSGGRRRILVFLGAYIRGRHAEVVVVEEKGMKDLDLGTGWEGWTGKLWTTAPLGFPISTSCFFDLICPILNWLQHPGRNDGSPCGSALGSTSISFSIEFSKHLVCL